jgi:hypothetical protein
MSDVLMEIVEDALTLQDEDDETKTMVFLVHTIKGDFNEPRSLDIQTRVCMVEY